MIGSYTTTNIIVFSVLVVSALIIDLAAHRQDKAISMKSAGLWSIFWILLALAFGYYIAKTHGTGDATLYLTGYLLEKSLSVDNLFVMMAIFANFAIPDKYQHRVLYYGILGALVFRMVFVAAGASLLAVFGTWALLVFGLFVLWSAWKMYQSLNADEEEITDYSQHWSVRGAAKFIPVHNQLEGHNFFVRKHGIRMATPLFLCLIAIEIADVMFAFDSVPAIFAITQEPFLVYSSNIFAILGLRSLYFLLAAARRWLGHLDKAVVAVLAFIGIKMLVVVISDLLAKTGDPRWVELAHTLHIPPLANLAIVGSLLAVGVLASIVMPPKSDDEKDMA